MITLQGKSCLWICISIILLDVASVGKAHNFPTWCPEKCECEIEKRSIECSGNRDQNIIIERKILVENGIKRLDIRNCGIVTLTTEIRIINITSINVPICHHPNQSNGEESDKDDGITPKLQLQEVVFSNLPELRIEPYALSNIEGSLSITIEHIPHLELKQFPQVKRESNATVQLKTIRTEQLKGRSKVSSLKFQGVRVQTLQEKSAFFDDFEIDTLELIDSSIAIVEPNSFQVNATTDILIKNTTFGEIKSNGIRLLSSPRVRIENCSFQILRSEAIALKDIDKFLVEKSNFGDIETNGFGEHVGCQKAKFEANVFQHLHQRALTSLPSEHVDFFHNLIVKADVNSLMTENETTEHAQGADIRANRFSCDCSTYWLTRDVAHKRMFMTSTCFQPPQYDGVMMSKAFESMKENKTFSCPETGTVQSMVADRAHGMIACSRFENVLVLLLVASVTLFVVN